MPAGSRGGRFGRLRTPLITATAALAIFAYGLMSALLGALLPGYVLTLDQQGDLALTNALGLLVASLVSGPLIDRQGKKPALLIGLGLIAVAVPFAGSAISYPSLLGVYFTLGVGGAIVTTGANSLIATVASARRGSALNFVNLFFGLGGILTTYAASRLLRPAPLCDSIAGTAVVALLAALVAKIPKPEDLAKFCARNIFALLSNKTLLLCGCLLFLYVACEVGVWNWLKLYLISRRFDAQAAGGVVSYGFGLGILLGRLGASLLLARRSSLAVLTSASVLIMLTTFLMLHMVSRGAVTATVFCAGLVMAPVFPTTLSLVGDHFQRSTAAAVGMVVSAGWLGLALSSPVIGALAATTSLRQGLLLLPALALAMVLVCLVLAVRLPKTRQA